MQPGNHLRDAAAGRVAPQHDVAQLQVRDQRGDVLDVILDHVRALRVPRRIAVAAHIDGEHMIVRREVRSDVIECAGGARDAVEQDQRRLAGRAPV